MSKKNKAVEAEEVVEEQAAPKVTSSKEPTDERREPKAGSPKDIVFQAGRVEGGGSIKEVAERTERTESNVRQHIVQCHTSLGFGYTITGDNFTIDGDATLTWEDQLAAREEAKAAKKAEKAAEAPAEDGGEDILD